MKPTPRLAMVVAASTVGYLGLAILGKGGMSAFFSNKALTAVAIATVAMSLVSVFTGGNLSPGEREDRSNRWVLLVFALVGLLSGYLPAFTDREEIWTLDGDLIRWIGVVLFVVGGVLRLWPVFVLGRRFSGLVAIQPGHTLATDGVYRVIRNPSYLGLAIKMIGWSLAFRSIVGILLAAVLVPPLIARIRAEEALLRAQFGDQYDAYRARTWRMIPWLY